MAQQNRRKSRKGGTSARGPKAREDAQETPGTYESGEEQLTEAQVAVGRPVEAERPNEQELTDFEETDAGHGIPAPEADRPAPVAVVERGPSLPARTVGFVQGSWRELKRVQWPDRRQVFQATGVVLGFVIVAGAFLGVASFAAQKIVNLILYGHG